LFTDIEGSTSVNEELGDVRWIELIRKHNAIVRELVAAHGGTEVKTIGDAFMVAFSSPRRALRCAIELQRAFSAHNRDAAAVPLRVRIGIHAGEPVREGGDFYGKSVTLASRIADQAHGSEILVSDLIKELTDAAGDFEFDFVGETTPKGFSRPQRLYAVRWDGA
jgi:class 3 adenylate cyclase